MGYSVRTFLIAGDDTVWRLASNRLWQMLHDPASQCLPAFAGQRIRTADVIVELKAREPVQVVRRTFFILTFDPEGHIDLGKFGKQQSALAELFMAPVSAFNSDHNQTIVEAASRFIAQGGQWVPSSALARIIDELALGQRRCGRA
ncbi:hypothetical protein [Paraburkholderia sp. SIMBA_054]|uniref:hypothetical protein n=1 Tax=Paraburkholderia sp. SIMBA_054 TaxID=3085795 RepID=UPI003979B9B2